MNKYRHPKSSLFLMEIMLNILFFSVLVTICLQLFFKAYTLSNDTSALHRAVTACTSLAEVYQSDENSENVILTLYPNSIELNDAILIYFDKQFTPCQESKSCYRAIIEKNGQTNRTSISFFALDATEAIYTLEVSSYAPRSLESFLGGASE